MVAIFYFRNLHLLCEKRKKKQWLLAKQQRLIVY